jgi:hypothetical protein
MFWKEKSVENMVTFEGLSIKHDFLSYLAVQKIAIQCSHVEFLYFIMGSHLGQWHRPYYFNKSQLSCMASYTMASYGHATHAF